MPKEKETFTTSQLGVVAWFIYNSLHPIEMFREGSAIVWSFPAGPDTQRLIKAYNSEDAAVHPRIYNKIFSQTKTEMLAMKSR